MDHVDRILAQWNRERPDLDVGPMGVLGRFGRVRAHLSREIERVLAEHGLSGASFDVLATLRRSGAPYRLSPGDLLATAMVTSGTMTNRIDQLEKAGLVERVQNPQDGRSVLISLTSRGLALVDEAVTAHVENQHRLAAALSPAEQRELDALLRKFLTTFE
ncbi:DNA-binding MarR family transcriptional regulator [Mycoplana sp. BE70]|uniref:MarR family winged helix-turn-helix transcriptional regulator n=1 Tax=Mycoplana sp. BE70 TaxID=2817775 RepID=UPI0028610110|nr:MarR family transcriptional regulator [Mycoplana sp. BE70]MDR6755365.1 DNA-binding MarR family transcriptional regulator [Mycoplana sp. BE70]